MRHPVALLFALLFTLPAFADRPAAQSAVADGDARLARGDWLGAEAAYTRAIEADPSWADAWGKRGDARLSGALGPACLEDYTQALKLAPQDFNWRFLRAQAYLMYDRPAQGLEDLDVLLRKAPDHPESVSMRGVALVLSGDVDGGLAEQDRAFKLGGGNPLYRIRGEGLARKADWNGLLAEIDGRRAGGIFQMADAWYRVVAQVELGQWDAAEAAVKEVARSDRGVAAACRLYLVATPQAGTHFNRLNAEADLAALADAKFDSNQIVNRGRALLLLGRAQDALDLLTMRGRRTHFGTVFWMGAAAWKLGRFPEARALLGDAYRLNP